MKISAIMLLFISEIVFSFFRISMINDSIDSSYKNYFEGNFEESLTELNLLTDSLSYNAEGISLNKASSYYRKEAMDSWDGFFSEDITDSIKQQKLNRVQEMYASVWTEADDLASIAYNQYGIIEFKKGVKLQDWAKVKGALQGSLVNFKSAMLRDPENNEARYNYELIRRYIEFPESLMDKVKGLVASRKYAEALQLISPWVEKDIRFKTYQEYTKKLSDIVNIELSIES